MKIKILLCDYLGNALQFTEENFLKLKEKAVVENFGPGMEESEEKFYKVPHNPGGSDIFANLFNIDAEPEKIKIISPDKYLAEKKFRRNFQVENSGESKFISGRKFARCVENFHAVRKVRIISGFIFKKFSQP